MISHFLTPTLMSMDVSIFLMTSLTTLLLQMCSIAEYSFGGTPYFSGMAMISALLEVSKTLNRSDNATHVGILQLCISCRSALIVNVMP